MRPIVLISVLGLLTILWIFTLWSLLRLPRTGLLATLSVNDVVGIVNTIFTVVSIFIAVAAYQFAVKSGTEQGDVLRSQKDALDESRKSLAVMVESSKSSNDALSQMLSVADRTRLALEEQLSIVQRQQAEAAAELAKRPELLVDLEPTNWLVKRADGTFMLDLQGNQAASLTLAIVNTGNATLTRPTFILRGNPSSVLFSPAQSSNIVDMLPEVLSSARYQHQFSITVPPGVTRFEILFSVFGPNFAQKSFTIPVFIGSS